MSKRKKSPQIRMYNYAPLLLKESPHRQGIPLFQLFFTSVGRLQPLPPSKYAVGLRIQPVQRPPLGDYAQALDLYTSCTQVFAFR